ncbi:MAG: hypothetical protein Q8P18_34315 [Pseudomonadota bacterium]|nr:hypothetical protein [Pseudomonadota bacterium]
MPAILLPPPTKRQRCPIRALPTVLLLASPYFLAACGDTTLSKYVEPPVVAIENPLDGTIIDADVSVVLSGRVIDESYEDSLNLIDVLWAVNGGQVCETAVFDLTGISTCDYVFSPGAATVSITATDPGGQTASASIELIVEAGNAPAVEILTPSTGDRVNDGDIILFSATVADIEDSPADLLVSWESDLDGVLDTNGAASSGDLEFASNVLSVGTHSILLSVTDSDGNVGVDRLTLFVNGPPEAPVVQITPDPAGADDTLRATIVTESADPNGDTISYSFAWYQNGALTGHTGNTVPASDTARGDVWEVNATPSDGFDIGPFGVDDIVVGNAPPTLSSVTITPGTAYTDDTLTAVPSGFSDSDGDPEGYRYQWTLNGTDIVGATDPTLSGTYFVKSDQLTVTVTPWDGTNVGSTVTSGIREIQNSPPTAPLVAISPEYPEDDAPLECSVVSASVDADGDPVTYTYAWTNNGTATSITVSSVSSSDTSNADIWVCNITPNDGSINGAIGSDSVEVNDYTAPDSPVLTSIDTFRNEDTVTLIGTSEAFSTITLYWTTSTGSGSDTTTANGAGLFTFSQTLTRALTYSFYATSSDAEGNTSGISNTVSTEACDPWDQYEDSSGYGDTCTSPVIDWSTLADTGATTLSVVGNLIASGDEDWYLIQTSDGATSGINYYNFHVELVDGASDYAFVVYEGGCTESYLDCGSGSGTDPEGSGYTEYQAYARDVGDGGHGAPVETRACEAGSPYYNVCDNLSSDYYIHVIRLSSFSCANYELQITNGR